MQLDEDSAQRYVEREATPMPGQAEVDRSAAAGRFTELPDDEAGMEVEGGMDVD